MARLLNIGRYSEDGADISDSNEVVFESLDSSEYGTEGSESILGVVLDAVRNMLAEWVLHHGSSINATTWYPPLQSEEISFLPSKAEFEFICIQSGFYIDAFIISECQLALQQRLGQHDIESQHLLSSTALIALLLVSYPALDMKVIEDWSPANELRSDNRAKTWASENLCCCNFQPFHKLCIY